MALDFWCRVLGVAGACLRLFIMVCYDRSSLEVGTRMLRSIIYMFPGEIMPRLCQEQASFALSLKNEG